MGVTICGRFCPDEGVVAGYGNRIRAKFPAKWGVQIVRMIFQTRSRVKALCLRQFSRIQKPAWNRPGVVGCSAGVLLILRWCGSTLEVSGRRSPSRYARAVPCVRSLNIKYTNRYILHKMILSRFFLSQTNRLTGRIGDYC